MEAEVLHLTILLGKGRVEEGPRSASATPVGVCGWGPVIKALALEH